MVFSSDKRTMSFSWVRQSCEFPFFLSTDSASSYFLGRGKSEGLISVFLKAVFSQRSIWEHKEARTVANKKKHLKPLSTPSIFLFSVKPFGEAVLKDYCRVELRHGSREILASTRLRRRHITRSAMDRQTDRPSLKWTHPELRVCSR